MFRIKICGVTTPNDAQTVAAAGADAVGLNFFPQSPRFLTAERAAAVVAALPRSVLKVGLFVNAHRSAILQGVETFGLDAVQLHGDEPAELLASLAIPVIKAFRLGPAGLDPVLAWLDTARQLGSLPKMVLLDAYLPGQYGGTGETTNWRLAAEYCQAAVHPPLLLAGGLNPANVAAAIAAVGPFGVDTASGVEQSPGVKSPRLVGDFVAAARGAFDWRR